MEFGVLGPLRVVAAGQAHPMKAVHVERTTQSPLNRPNKPLTRLVTEECHLIVVNETRWHSLQVRRSNRRKSGLKLPDLIPCAVAFSGIWCLATPDLKRGAVTPPPGIVQACA